MDDLEQCRWERLLRWLSEAHGMDISERAFHVEAREVVGAGRGLFASRDCPPSTTLFRIPSTALMNRRTIEKLYSQLRGQNLSAVQLVSLHLLLHRPLGDSDSEDPTFGPYISTLPRDFSSHPLSWVIKHRLRCSDTWEDLMLDLLPPSVLRKLSELHDKFWTDWKSVHSTLARNPNLTVNSSCANLALLADGVDDLPLTMDYLWAWLNVNTRCIFYRIYPKLSDPDNFTLCPVLDFANHRREDTHIFPVVDSEAWGGMTKKPSTYYTFIGTSRGCIPHGQELYLQYGSHSDSFLLAEYGFVNDVPEGSAASGAYPGEVDVQEVMEDLLAQDASLHARVRSTLEREGYWGDWTLHSAPLPAHPSYRLITALRLYAALADLSGAEDTAHQGAIDQWRRVVQGYTDRISAQNEEKWKQYLLRMCEAIIERARMRMMASLEAKEASTDDAGWRRWMVGNVCTLWREELEVAESVKASVLEGEEF